MMTRFRRNGRPPDGAPSTSLDLARLIGRDVPELLFLLRNSHIEFASSGARRAIGLDESESGEGLDVLDLFHPDARESVRCALTGTNAGVPARVEAVEMVSKRPGDLHVDIRFVPFRFDEHDRILLFCTPHESSSGASPDFEKFFELSQELFCIANTDGRFLHVNRAIERLLGYSREHLLDRPYLDLVHPDDVDQTRREMDSLGQGIPSVSFVNRFVCEDGQIRTLRWTSRPVGGGILYAVAHDVTAEYQIRKELSENYRRMELALEGAGLGFWDYDLETGILEFDEHWAARLGSGPSDRYWETGRWLNAVHPDDRHHVQSTVRAGLDPSDDRVHMQYRIRDAAGAWCWLSARGQHAESEVPGHEGRIVGAHRDVTEQVLADQRAERTSAIRDGVLDAMTAHVAIVNDKGIITAVNKAWKSFSESEGGTCKDTCVGTSYLSACDPNGAVDAASADYMTRVDSKLRDLLTGGAHTFTMEYPCHAPDEDRWFHMRADAFNVEGRRYAMIAHDNITDQVLDRQRLEDSEYRNRRLANVVERTTNGAIVADKDGLIEWVNSGFTRITGYSFEEAVGREPGDLLQGPGTDQDVVAMMEARMDRQEPFTAELLNYRKDGTSFWNRVDVQPTYDEAGAHTGYVGIETDITERVEQQDRVQKSRKQWQDLLDRNPVPVLVHRHSTVLYANDAAARLVGSPSDEDLSGVKMHVLFDESTVSALEREDACEKSNEDPLAIRTMQGQMRHVQAVSMPVEFNDVEARQVILSDVTDRIERERSLTRAKEDAERISTVKTSILNNISHELRTPLSAIIGFADILAENLSGDDRQFVSMIQESGEKLLDSLNRILDLANIRARGKEEMNLRPLDLHDIVQSVVDQTAERYQTSGPVIRFHAVKHPNVLADVDGLQRIVKELLANAAKFGNGGDIHVTIDSDDVNGSVSIRDEGIGIETELAETIFEAFRQESGGLTREFDGFGLGLTLVRHLVTEMNGTVAVHSEKNSGATFTVRLPVADTSEASMTWPIACSA